MRRLRLGILATEFFDERLGGFGGFGFAARRIATLLRETDAPIEPSFILGRDYGGHGLSHLDGFQLLSPAGIISKDLRLFRSARLDLIISVDWRSGFRYITRVSPFSDLIVWINAPIAVRQRFQMRSVAAATDPGAGANQTRSIPSRSNLRSVVRETHFLPRKIVWASTSPALIERFNLAHGLELTHACRLGYGVRSTAIPARREAPRPRFLTLGRIAPEKRPWIICDVARQLPGIEFRLAGDGKADLLGDSPPANVIHLGHLDESEKQVELSQSWGLVSSSATEGMPIAFIEALLAGVPLVSTIDPELLVSRFGIYVENLAGSGRDLAEPLASAVRRAVELRATERRDLGQAGRRWALEHHSDYAFLCDLAQILANLGWRDYAEQLMHLALERLANLRASVP